jgi:hypothetical protein
MGAAVDIGSLSLILLALSPLAKFTSSRISVREQMLQKLRPSALRVVSSVEGPTSATGQSNEPTFAHRE